MSHNFLHLRTTRLQFKSEFLDDIHNFQLDSLKQFSSYLAFPNCNIQTVRQAVRRRAKDVAFISRATKRRQLKMGQTKNV